MASQGGWGDPIENRLAEADMLRLDRARVGMNGW